MLALGREHHGGERRTLGDRVELVVGGDDGPRTYEIVINARGAPHREDDGAPVRRR